MVDQTRIDAINQLKTAILRFLGTNGRHYGDLKRIEQSVEDLAQALNTRLDQMAMFYKGAVLPGDISDNDPGQRLADRFMATASGLMSKTAHVDSDTVDQFESALDMFDVAADLRRHADTAQDAGETAALKHKRNR